MSPLTDHYLPVFAQDSKGGMWFGGDNGLTRYEPVLSTNPTPAVLVQTDQVYANLQALPHITAGRLVTFKVNAVDFRTRPEKRLYRYAVVLGRVAGLRKWRAPHPPIEMSARRGRGSRILGRRHLLADRQNQPRRAWSRCRSVPSACRS